VERVQVARVLVERVLVEGVLVAKVLVMAVQGLVVRVQGEKAQEVRVQGLGLAVLVARVQGLAVLAAAVLGWVGVQEQETGRPPIACKAGQQRHSRIKMKKRHSQVRACCTAAACYAAAKPNND
jgi:hypothetical protein